MVTEGILEEYLSFVCAVLIHGGLHVLQNSLAVLIHGGLHVVNFNSLRLAGTCSLWANLLIRRTCIELLMLRLRLFFCLFCHGPSCLPGNSIPAYGRRDFSGS